MISSENDISPKDNIITFDVTKKMKETNISQFYLKKNDFVIKFEDGGARSIHFDSKNPSVNLIIKYVKSSNKNLFTNL